MYPGDFLVSDHLLQPLQCILGWDFLTSNKLCLSCNGTSHYFLLDSHGETPLLPTQPVPAPYADGSGGDVSSMSCLLVQSSSQGPVPVTLKENLNILGRTEVIVTARLPKNYTDQVGIITPIPNKAGFVLPAYSVTPADNRSILVRLMNTAGVDVELHAGQKFSEFCPLFEAQTPFPDSSPCLVLLCMP